MIDVVLPVLNEIVALPWVLSRMRDGYRPIVADNGSTDGSARLADRDGPAVVVEPPGDPVREVVDDLHTYRDIAYTTVMTVMDNLHRKGALTREKDGRAWRYRAARTRDEYAAELLESVLDEAGDRGAALMRFVGRMRPHRAGRAAPGAGRAADRGRRR